MAKRKAASKPTSATYRVAGEGVTAVSHGQDVYPVEDGYVELPPGAGWVQTLVADGMVAKGKGSLLALIELELEAERQLELEEEDKVDKGKPEEGKQDEDKSKK